MSNEHNGFLFVADISGYTGYLNASELEHAHGTLTDLIQILLDRAGPPLTVSKLEGDAVFSYGFEDAFADGQTFMELVEDTYVTFRRAIDSMVLNNTCRCNACANVTSLDLKFVVHFGSFLFQHFGDRDELVGSDVNLIHRLMKNSVPEETGIRAYCLYTDAAHARLGLEGIGGLTRHHETVPDFGTMGVWVHDMAPAYEAAKEEPGITLTDDEVLFVLEADLPMPPSVVWEYLADPMFRNIMVGTERQEITDRSNGRIGVGTAYQCYHGKQVVPQTIIEWDPFRTVVTEDLMPRPWKGSGLAVMRLEATDEGTHLSRVLGGMKIGRLMRLLGRLGFYGIIRKIQTNSFEAFLEAVRADWRQRSAATTPPTQISAESIDDAARHALVETVDASGNGADGD